MLIVSKLGYDTGDVYVNGETTEEDDAAGNKLREAIPGSYSHLTRPTVDTL